MKTTRRSFFLSSALALAVHAAHPRKAQRLDPWMPKLSENLPDVKPSTLRWLKQIGCKHVIFQGTDHVDSDSKGYWTLADVMHTKKHCDEAGLNLESMMIPIDFYHKARLGQPGRDEEIDKVCRTIWW